MAVTMVTAAESTGNVDASQQIREVANRLLYLDPSENPFTLLVAEMDKQKVGNFKFEWAEKDLLQGWSDQINGAATTSDTALTVDNGWKFTIGDLVKVSTTGETLRVSQVGATTITVSRAVGSVSATNIADNADLFILSSAQPEGASVGTPLSQKEAWLYNYTQLIRTPFGVTGTEEAVANYFGSPRARLRKEKGIEHAVKLERAFLFSERNRFTGTVVGASANTPVNLTGGVLSWITSNVVDAGGTLSEPEVWDFCRKVFEATAGGNTRSLFAAPIVCSVIDLLAGARLMTVPSDQTFGIAIKQWVTSHGTLNVIKHRALSSGLSGAGAYGNYALAINMPSVGYRYLRDTALLPNRQNPGDDKFVDEYLSECGLEFHNEQVHGVLKNVTA